MEYSNELRISGVLDEHPQHTRALWRIWLHRHRTRKQLHALMLGEPDRLNHDLGISTEEATAEIKKPFWQE